MRRLALLAALAAAVLVVGCGGSAAPTIAPTQVQTQAPSEIASPDGGAAGSTEVEIVDFAFEPADLTVKVGDTVTWTNTGDAPHTVKWDDDEPESEQLQNGATYERTFDSAGTFAYACGIHSAMTGTITVE